MRQSTENSSRNQGPNKKIPKEISTSLWIRLPYQNQLRCQSSSSSIPKPVISTDIYLPQGQKTLFCKKSFNGGANTVQPHPLELTILAFSTITSPSVANPQIKGTLKKAASGVLTPLPEPSPCPGLALFAPCPLTY